MTGAESDPAGLDRFGLAFRCLGWLFLQAPSAANTGLLLAAEDQGGWLLDGPDPATRAGLAQLAAARAGWDGTALAALGADYNRLFVGPGPLLAPPWESAQRSVDHLLFDRHTLAVRAWFARFGLEAPERGREPDDHLGLELAFMGHLCDLAAAAAPAARAELRRAMAGFLDEHLLRWAPACLEQVRTRARTLYYQGLANLTLGCLAQAAQDLRGGS